MAWHNEKMTVGAWYMLIGTVIIITAVLSPFISKILIGVGFVVGYFGIYKDLKAKK